jgi:hypothetical protein
MRLPEEPEGDVEDGNRRSQGSDVEVCVVESYIWVSILVMKCGMWVTMGTAFI